MRILLTGDNYEKSQSYPHFFYSYSFAYRKPLPVYGNELQNTPRKKQQQNRLQTKHSQQAQKQNRVSSQAVR